MEHLIYAKMDERVDDLATRWSNLADPRIGTKVTFVTDEFFAPRERMLSIETPVFIPNKFDDNGKWMDGWETRRRRTPGHDFCVIKLGLPGIIKALDIDTSHFTGNYPVEAWVEACWSQDDRVENADWVEIAPKTKLSGNIHNIIDVSDDTIYSHVRLHIAPDGGIARFRVFGLGRQNWKALEGKGLPDLAAMANGGRAVAWNDAHFGMPSSLISPGRGLNMGDGWETRRRREPGNDWLFVRLGKRGRISRVEIDTAHFKGNYPDAFSLKGALLENPDQEEVVAGSEDWPILLDKQKLEADSVFVFEDEVKDIGIITHVRLDIFPDGGVSRLRLFGKPELNDPDDD